MRDLAALVGGDGFALSCFVDQVKPLRAFNARVDAIDCGWSPGAGVHGVGNMICLEVRLDGGLVCAVNSAWPCGMILIELAIRQNLVVDRNRADENELLDAGKAGRIEESQRS